MRHHRNSCGWCRGSSSSRRRLSTRQVLVIQSPECVQQVQDMDTIVDFLLVLQHQVQTILTMQRQRRFLSTSSLPEMGQRQVQTEKIQKTVAKTQGQIAQTFSDHPEDPEVCRGTTSCSETEQIAQRSRRPSRFHN